MKTILVTGSDTGVGKTWVVGALARAFSSRGLGVQIVKPVETGVDAGAAGDAVEAARFAGNSGKVEAFTLSSYRAGIAPLDAARQEGKRFSLVELEARIRALSRADIRIVEGAGGIAVPLSESGEDWASFANALEVDGTLIVLPDRLGAINQGRLCHRYAVSASLRHAFWLNAKEQLDTLIAESNRSALRQDGMRIAGASSVGQRGEVEIDWEWFAV